MFHIDVTAIHPVNIIQVGESQEGHPVFTAKCNKHNWAAVNVKADMLVSFIKDHLLLVDGLG